MTERVHSSVLAALCLVAGIACLLFVEAARAETPAARTLKTSEHQAGLPGNVRGNARDPELWRFIGEGGAGHRGLRHRQGARLIQSSGQRWRSFREKDLPRYGTWGLAGILSALALFFILRGRIRIQAGFSAQSVLRFWGIERFAHWLLAISFLLHAVTGLNLLYGSEVVKPLIGHVAFAKLAGYSKWLHYFTSYPLMLGLVLIIPLWARDNLPNRQDLSWLAKGGGLFSRGMHPPAKRFNAGQKLIFWFVIVAGALMSISGFCLLLPFAFAPFGGIFTLMNSLGFSMPPELSELQEMQLVHAFHSVLGIVMIVVVIAHIYVGSIGMEGAFDAMASGYVDENWAREHHSLWVEELRNRGTAEPIDPTQPPNRKRMTDSS